MTTKPLSPKTKDEIVKRPALKELISMSFIPHPRETFSLSDVPLTYKYSYYDFVTTAFLNGWSTKFHFSPFPSPTATIEGSLSFYEHRLAHVMNLQPHHLVLDVGCGVGGPAREIARFIGCRVIGISNNQRHIDVAIRMTAEAGLSHQCSFVKGDFMELNKTFAESSFDAAYATEATVHAPSLPDVYASIASILKPNGVFGLWEWVLTQKFDYNNAHHIGIRNRIERGNALSNLVTIDECRDAYLRAGFEIYHDHDYANHFDYVDYPPPPVMNSPYTTVEIPFAATYKHPLSSVSNSTPTNSTAAKTSHTNPNPNLNLAPPPTQPLPPSLPNPTFRPWHFPLTGSTSQTSLKICPQDVWTTFKMSPLSRRVCYSLISMFERIGVVPKGSRELTRTMAYCVDSVVEGGREGVFSPLWWVVGRKVGGAARRWEGVGSSGCVEEVVGEGGVGRVERSGFVGEGEQDGVGGIEDEHRNESAAKAEDS